MFTWNFQYISKTRLADTFDQLKLSAVTSGLLIRIHTAIHTPDEAVEIARYIKELIPGASIFGTSTSAVISWGRLASDQCVISVTQMDQSIIKTAMIPASSRSTNAPKTPVLLCEEVRDAVVTFDTKLILAFLTQKYRNIYSFVEQTNVSFPNVSMIGGVTNCSDMQLPEAPECGFVFDENGWSDDSVMLASFSGDDLECCVSFTNGAQAVGEEMTITDTFGRLILSVDGGNAGESFSKGIRDELIANPDTSCLFPFVYSGADDIPILVGYSENESIGDNYSKDDPSVASYFESHSDMDTSAPMPFLRANHFVPAGKKIRRAFIYDRKVIADNRALFRKMEDFDKAETFFGYSCIGRVYFYPNCVQWELSAYENTNICGCITEGEITRSGGRNVFANCTFSVAVAGEKSYRQEYNAYAFSSTDFLAEDNRRLTDQIMALEKKIAAGAFEDEKDAPLREFVSECESKIFTNDTQSIPNISAMKMDISTKGYDRMCIINVIDKADMDLVFSKNLIELTYKNFMSKCTAFAKKKKYNIYEMEKWQIALGKPSYKISLKDFTDDMRELQNRLFENVGNYISIVPVFCVIDGCTVNNIDVMYYTSRVDMEKKNVQFYVCDAYSSAQLDESSIREKYHMVNVINYALANSKVIPYYQGIRDNKTGTIHHYESLMRLEDENGRIYSPGSFLDVARRYGLLYDQMSKMMIRKVFWKFSDETDKSVSINLGIRDIKNPEITEFIFDNLNKAAVPGNFVFEILENEDIDDYEEMMSFVDRIHELGGRISIDDFGSGFSNLRHISAIHSDYLKIDGSIIKECCEHKEAEVLIALISDWKKISTREIKIVAEFVENQAIQDMLMKYNIDFSQGYLFSKPSPDIT